MTDKFLSRDPEEELSKVSRSPVDSSCVSAGTHMQAFRLFDEDKTGRISLKVGALWPLFLLPSRLQ